VIDFIGHIGYASFFAGMILLGRTNELGWLFRVLGGIIWISVGFAIGLTSIWAWGFAFLLVDIRSYFRWRKRNL